MMNKVTPIEWVKNPDGSQGYTWNPITGCLNGCEYCYARKLANGRLRKRYLANDIYAIPPEKESSFLRDIMADKPIQPSYDPFYPRFWPERLDQLSSSHYYHPEWEEWRLPFKANPKGIFTCNMSDLFGINIPEAWTRKVLEVIRTCPMHRFYLLTKQPQNLSKFSPFPDNAWVGVSATDYDMMLDALNELCQVEAKIKYISFEPLLSWRNPYSSHELRDFFEAQQLDWLIIGSCTKPYKPPKIEWVREIVGAADRAGVPVFLKDNLRDYLAKSGLGHWDGFWSNKPTGISDIKEWKLRQEMPEG